MAQLRTWTSADMHIGSHLCNSIDGRYMQLASLLSFEQLICTISRDISARLNGSLLYARSGELFQLAWRGVHRNCENAAMPKFMAGSRICTIRRTISACLENAAMPKFMAGSRTLEIPTSTSHERHHCSAELCSCSVAVRVCEALN
jgi:hypothetical protein